MSSFELKQLLSNSTSDSGLTSCLLSCSNRGQCRQDSNTGKLFCACDESYFTGDSCQYDIRPCSSLPCLNGASCSNILDTNLFSFECNCMSAFYGTNCQNIRDLCANVTCVKGQGYCRTHYVDFNPTATCICLIGYLGNDCSQKSSTLQVHITIVSVTSILAISIIVFFWAFILFMDYVKYFVIKSNRFKETEKNQKNIKQKTVLSNHQGSKVVHLNGKRNKHSLKEKLVSFKLLKL